jgi:hypothetical protein
MELAGNKHLVQAKGAVQNQEKDLKMQVHEQDQIHYAVKAYVPGEVVGYHHLPFSKEKVCVRKHNYTFCKIIGNTKKLCTHHP